LFFRLRNEKRLIHSIAHTTLVIANVALIKPGRFHEIIGNFS